MNKINMASQLIFPTPVDYSNARKYAMSRLLYEKFTEAKKKYSDIEWKGDTFISYSYPKNLKEVHDGFPVISTKTECSRMSKYDQQGTLKGIPDNQTPGFLNGWFLNWKETDANTHKGICFMENHLFRNDCITGFKNNSENTVKKALPVYDKSNARCNITKEYCDNYGYGKYQPDGNGGGICELNTGMSVAETLFGNTITRGILGGGCFTKSK